MNSLSEQFAKRLKQLRQRCQMTQQDLAQRSGLSLSFIRALEQGVHTPSFSSIEALAKAFDISYRDLFDFD